MKQIILTFALLLSLATITTAQQENIRPIGNTSSSLTASTLDSRPDADENYQRMLKNLYKVELRAVAINALGLTDKKEIADFTRVYMNYMDEKNMLVQRRKRLVQRYVDEMAEDDSARDEENETADFIENFLELNIDEMELQKDYFDVLEDEIGSTRALQFFAMEDMYAQRARRSMIMKMLPDMVILTPVHSNYEKEMADYNRFNRIRIDGEVSYDHDYVYNGLSTLWNAAEKMANSEGVMIPNFRQKKQQVMMKADQMKKNWRSLNHADLAREAFQMTASALGELARDSRFQVSESWLTKLSNQANAIRPQVKLTDQGAKVNAFFDTAEYVFNQLVEQANKVK